MSSADASRAVRLRERSKDATDLGSMPASVDDRWEHGSDLPLLPFAIEPSPTMPWAKGARFAGSGRAALLHLVAHGVRRYGWRRLWIPGFYCPDVITPVAACGVELSIYDAGPFTPDAHPPLQHLTPHDAVLVVNLYGLRHGAPRWTREAPGVTLIEDHTHDPASAWARASVADWCFASLRKTMPIPDGGVLWSPRGHGLPGPLALTDQHVAATHHKLAGMTLKASYLRGEFADKALFREELQRGESAFAVCAPSAMSPWSELALSGMPVERWRAIRRANHSRLLAEIDGCDGFQVLVPDRPSEAAPAVCTVVLRSSGARDALRAWLIEQRVYPAVLWALSSCRELPLPASLVDLGERILSVHCDMRYTEADMSRVAGMIRAWLERLP